MALQLDPSFASCHSNLGIIYYYQRKFKQAIEHFSKALQISPDDDETYVNLGAAYLQLRKFKRAEDCFKHALKLNPQNNEARNNYQILQRRFNKNVTIQ
jgi:Flp pilus assembly protein TadD